MITALLRVAFTSLALIGGTALAQGAARPSRIALLFQYHRMAKLIFLGACALLPVQALGQASAKVARVGVFHIGDEAFNAKYTEAFIAGMAAQGYRVGKNLLLDVCHSDGSVADKDATAKELVANSDVVFAPSGTAANYTRKHGPKVPIVICCATDPVGIGLAKTLDRPGGTVTGLTTQSGDLIGKKLNLLRDVLPRFTRVAYLRPSWYPLPSGDIDALNRAAKGLGVEVQLVGVKGPEDLDVAFDAAMRSQPQALTLADAVLFSTNLQRIAELAAKHRVPVIYGNSEYVKVGGLMTYGADRVDLYRRAAVYVDKILKGAKPGDLPIEQPVKFELHINAKTAKALGIQIPQSLLLRADRVID